MRRKWGRGGSKRTCPRMACALQGKRRKGGARLFCGGGTDGSGRRWDRRLKRVLVGEFQFVSHVSFFVCLELFDMFKVGFELFYIFRVEFENEMS